MAFQLVTKSAGVEKALLTIHPNGCMASSGLRKHLKHRVLVMLDHDTRRIALAPAAADDPNGYRLHAINGQFSCAALVNFADGKTLRHLPGVFDEDLNGYVFDLNTTTPKDN